MLSLKSPDAILNMLGERIRVLRLARNLSQQDLAAMCGASLSSVRRLEVGGQGTLHLLVRAGLALDAAGGLDELFVLPSQTIAQAEAAAGAQQRQRARKLSVVAGGAGKER